MSLRMVGAAILVAALAARAFGAGMEVTESGEKPDLKVAVVSPGVYKVVVWQASGGGLNEFYDLATDPEAKTNLAGGDRGLFEIGWHGARFKSPPEKENCCVQHMRDVAAGKKKEGDCYDGCRDWPSMGHKALKAEGELEVIEKSPARVRVRAKSVFCWWGGYADKDLPVEAVYTFYPTGGIAVQVRVKRTGEMPMHWSGEYGPHFFLPCSKDPEGLRFNMGSPKYEDYTAGTKGIWPAPPSEELIMASSKAVKTTFFITIPPEEHDLFARHMRHGPAPDLNWDRFGYGNKGLVMEPGYDNTWACMIQMGTSGSALAPELGGPKDALPYAMQYRKPVKLSATGAEPVTDDEGDLNKDGFNESEGCYVLKATSSFELVYEKGEGAGLAPAFKILGWKGEAPSKVSIDGKEVPCAAGALDGKLILQVLGRIEADKAKIEIGK
jgi:hypothetical protein